MYRLLDENFIVIDCYNNIHELYEDAFNLKDNFMKLHYTTPYSDKIFEVDFDVYKLKPNYYGSAVIYKSSDYIMPIFDGCVITNVGTDWVKPNSQYLFNLNDNKKYLYRVYVENMYGHKIDFNNLTPLTKYVTKVNSENEREEIYANHNVKVINYEKYNLPFNRCYYNIFGVIVDN